MTSVEGFNQILRNRIVFGGDFSGMNIQPWEISLPENPNLQILVLWLLIC